jgi:hypothetical protein
MASSLASECDLPPRPIEFLVRGYDLEDYLRITALWPSLSEEARRSLGFSALSLSLRSPAREPIRRP